MLLFRALPCQKIDGVHAPSSRLNGGTLRAHLLVQGNARRTQDIAQGLALAHDVLVGRDRVTPARDHLRIG